MPYCPNGRGEQPGGPRHGQRQPDLRAARRARGGCGRQNLCLRHFDEAYGVCVDCARSLRGQHKQEKQALTELPYQMEELRHKAEKADAPNGRRPGDGESR